MGEVEAPNNVVVMDAIVCCTCVQEAASPRMTQGEQGYFLSHRVLRLRHCRQLRFLTLLLLPLVPRPLDGPAAGAAWFVRAVGETLALLPFVDDDDVIMVKGICGYYREDVEGARYSIGSSDELVPA